MSEIFHILNRGVDKRKIFMDEKDHFRFIHDLFEFNDQAPANTTFHIFRKYNVIARRKFEIAEKKPRKLLVEIHAFCLMPNHFHLLLTSKVENGISKFVKKLDMGYARYFNERYKRRGALFEGRYKSIPIQNEPHFLHIPYYIHLNPLDLVCPEWRNCQLKDFEKAINFLENYRWSSHLDYIGKKNFPSVTQREFLTECLGGPEEYERNLKQWLRSTNLEDIRDVILE